MYDVSRTLQAFDIRVSLFHVLLMNIYMFGNYFESAVLTKINEPFAISQSLFKISMKHLV